MRRINRYYYVFGNVVVIGIGRSKLNGKHLVKRLVAYTRVRRQHPSVLTFDVDARAFAYVSTAALSNGKVANSLTYVNLALYAVRGKRRRGNRYVSLLDIPRNGIHGAFVSRACRSVRPSVVGSIDKVKGYRVAAGILSAVVSNGIFRAVGRGRRILSRAVVG